MNLSRYWNPGNETMPREEIEALQIHKLKKLIEWADQKVPWQRERLRKASVSADKINSMDDLRRIPFMTRSANSSGLPRTTDLCPIATRPWLTSSLWMT